MKKHLLIVCFSFFISTLFSQENKQELLWFDDVVSQQNLPINQGIKYSEKYKTFNRNHHFLFADKFQKGDLKYNNQMYYNISMKYDTYEDNLILKISSKKENFPIILNRELISFFKINNKTFYNINLAGFYEILYKSENISLIKKYFSKKNQLKNNSFIYPNFTHEETLLILKNNKFQSIKKKKYFHKIFPNKKKLINVFFRMNTIMRKKNNEAFILKLIKKLDNE